MTTIAQWQAGTTVPGVAPWDGTGFPFPFNEDGSPAWPTPVEPIFDEAPVLADPTGGDLIQGEPFTLTITTLREPEGPLVFFYRKPPVAAALPFGVTTKVDATHYTVTGRLLNGGTYEFEARADGLISPPVTLTTTPLAFTVTAEPSTVAWGEAFTVTATQSAPLGPLGIQQLAVDTGSGLSLAVTEVDPLTFTATSVPASYPGTPEAPGALAVFAIQPNTSVQSEQTHVTVTPAPVVTLTLTSTPEPGDLALGAPAVSLLATASAPPAVNMVRFDSRVNGAEWMTNNPGGVGGPPGGPYGISTGQGSLVAGDVLEYRAANPPGPVADDTAATVYSNTITFTMTDPPVADPDEGWTVAELKEFAADHEPPIPIPSSANKAEILGIILAYLHAHPEEN